MQNQKKEEMNCDKPGSLIKPGQSCQGREALCISRNCINDICQEGLLKLGDICFCDIQCESGHCSFDYWLFWTVNHCTKY